MKCLQFGHLIRSCLENKENGPTEGSPGSGTNEAALWEPAAGEENVQLQGKNQGNRGELEQSGPEGKRDLGESVSTVSKVSIVCAFLSNRHR